MTLVERELEIEFGDGPSDEVELRVFRAVADPKSKPTKTIRFKTSSDDEAIAIAGPKFLIALSELGYTEGYGNLFRVVDMGSGIPDYYTIGHFAFDGDIHFKTAI